METGPRRDFSAFRGWTGSALLRPWFDRAAHAAIVDWLLPLSRAWAAGVDAKGSVDRFATALGPAAGAWPRAAAVLARLDEARRRHDEAAARWEAAFFGRGGAADGLASCETARFEAAKRLMTMRRAFLPLRRSVRRVAWEIAGPAAVEQAHGARLDGPAAAYPPPSPPPAIERSRALYRAGPGSRSGAGRREYWLRLPSPARAAADVAWARVFEPTDRPVRGAIVSLHGILMEQEMWLLADPVGDLVANGFRVIRPEGPWHGRRRLAGRYGGEPILARGILGFIELFEAWVVECAAWIGWARQEAEGPVALAGISLGALTSQLAVSVCGGWPAAMRPDAALLITTTADLADGAMRGSLGRSLAMPERLAEAGWTQADIHRWRALVEPAGAPAIDPGRIVMLLGDIDTITPYAGGHDLAVRWEIPPANLFVRRGGHFSTALSLYRDPAPLDRLAAIMIAAG